MLHFFLKANKPRHVTGLMEKAAATTFAAALRRAPQGPSAAHASTDLTVLAEEATLLGQLDLGKTS